MKTAIFSGFKKFGDYKANSTEIIGWKIRKTNIAGFDMIPTLNEALIHKEDRGKILLDWAEMLDTNCIIAMGMASNKKGLCIERTAVNRIYHERYVAPIQNNTSVKNGVPYKAEIKLDLVPWNIPLFKEKCQKEKIPLMEISDDAGTFCCNQLMYQFCKAQLDFPGNLCAKTPFIFIHVPCCPEAINDPDAFAKAGKITMPTWQVIRAITLLLENVCI